MSEVNLKGIGMTSQRTRDRLAERLASQGIDDSRVLSLIKSVPRHIFVDEALAHRAYEDTALPIGHGQTISQPFIVALMTQLLLEQNRNIVLEVGTGCGYQTAILSNLVERVFSIERLEALLPRTKARLRTLKIRNVQLRQGDGYEGWPNYAPFDGIIVTAAPTEIPGALLSQLAPGGRMVLPVGDGDVQDLRVIDHTPDGFVETVRESVRFVPLVRGA